MLDCTGWERVMWIAEIGLSCWEMPVVVHFMSVYVVWSQECDGNAAERCSGVYLVPVVVSGD
jgi:hypothetical protein